MCFLLLFRYSYYTTKSIEKEAKMPVFSKPKNEILNSTTTFGGGIYSRTVKVYSFI
jgi:predicted outer membrane repeat protein